MGSKEIEDRRQRAFEAGLDAATGMWDGDDFRNGTEEAVKVATQVKITDEIAAAANGPAPMHDDGTFRARAVLLAAGFEVIE